MKKKNGKARLRYIISVVTNSHTQALHFKDAVSKCMQRLASQNTAFFPLHSAVS